MKTVLLTALFCTQLSLLFAQETVSAIEITDFNILYRGYDNRVKFAVTPSENCEIRLLGNNCTIRKDSTNEFYYVRPGNGRIAILIVETFRGDSVLYSKRSEYRVSNLPYPVIYWGSAKSGGKAFINSRLLQAIYPPEVPLSANFTILNWELFEDGESKATGSEGNLSEASEYLETLKESTSLFFNVSVLGPDGISRNLEAHFTVDPTAQ